jgi:hypothetical protein
MPKEPPPYRAMLAELWAIDEALAEAAQSVSFLGPNPRVVGKRPAGLAALLRVAGETAPAAFRGIGETAT